MDVSHLLTIAPAPRRIIGSREGGQLPPPNQPVLIVETPIAAPVSSPDAFSWEAAGIGAGAGLAAVLLTLGVTRIARSKHKLAHS